MKLKGKTNQLEDMLVEQRLWVLFNNYDKYYRHLLLLYIHILSILINCVSDNQCFKCKTRFNQNYTYKHHIVLFDFN